MRFLPVGDNRFIVELENLDKTLALLDSLNAQPIDGMGELVPAARTLLVRFYPDIISRDALINEIAKRDLSNNSERHGAVIDIPVRYDGEDLSEVAALLGISIDEVIKRHTQSDYIVAFTGFAPGFAYLVNGDPIFDLPRRKSPRTRIPAGSVGLAGLFSGIYPQASPGGWQLIGSTDVAMFDLTRTPPALLQPGMRVHFHDSAKQKTTHIAPLAASAPHAPFKFEGKATMEVLAAPMPVYYQDSGRHNVASQGVSPSGALDRSSACDANTLVGNAPDATVLEITMGGLCLKALEPTVIALTGAPAQLTITTQEGKVLPSPHGTAPHGKALALEAGDSILLGYAAQGARVYLALRGGFETQTALFSASTDTLSNIGPAMIKAGDHLYVKPGKPAASVAIEPLAQRAFPESGKTVTLDVVMGPRTDWFDGEAIELFTTQLFEVTAQSNRVGARLQGAKPLNRKITNELPSEGTVTGALQVPANGQPVLFLNDRPLTGGYPVIAVVASYHLDLAGQLPVGAKIRFRAISDFKPLAVNNKGNE